MRRDDLLQALVTRSVGGVVIIVLYFWLREEVVQEIGVCQSVCLLCSKTLKRSEGFQGLSKVILGSLEGVLERS